MELQNLFEVFIFINLIPQAPGHSVVFGMLCYCSLEVDCHLRLDSIAVSVYWLSWTNTVSEQKIPITILILKRGPCLYKACICIHLLTHPVYKACVCFFDHPSQNKYLYQGFLPSRAIV